MKCEASREYCREFSVRKMCIALGLAEGAYYQWLHRKEMQEQKKQEEKVLVGHIREVFEKIKACLWIQAHAAGNGTARYGDQ